jgi:hypothetical protein
VKALLACGDRQLVGCVRASNSVAEVSGRRRAQRSVLPVARGWVDGSEAFRVFAREPEGRKGVDKRYRGGKAMAPGRPEPGARKGIAGAKVSARWKALWVVSLVVRSRGRLDCGLGGSHESRTRASVTGSWERRQECQRLGKRASRREDNARRDDQPCKTGACRPPKRTALSWNRRLLDGTSAQALDAERTNDARVLIRRSEMAEVGPTHRALRRPVSRKASRRRDAGQGALRSTC